MQNAFAHLPRPEFKGGDRRFQKELNQRVSAYFRDNKISPQSTLKMKIKALALYVALFGLYASFFVLPQSLVVTFITATAVAATQFLIGMNVMHDCAHGTLFKNPLAKKLALCVWDLFAVSGDVYRVKHVEIHHEFTNVTAWDGDMDLSYPVLRLNPKRPWKPKHRYQIYYAPLLYSLITLSWIFLADFAAIASRKVLNYDVKPFSKLTVLKIVLFKIANIGLCLVIPSLFFPVWKVILTFVYIQMALGFSLALIFQAAHINEKAIFEMSESGSVDRDWALHQLLTSANFATKSPFWGFALGGLNFQIEHHLFPAICHAHYPAMSEIVRGVCRDLNLPYNEFSTFREAAGSHFRLLRELGREGAL